MVGLRGSPKKPGFGNLQPVVDQLMVKLPGSDGVAIDYPASGITTDSKGKPVMEFDKYKASLAVGLANFSAEVKAFVQRCPDTGIIAIGESQASIFNETRLKCHQH